MTRDELNALLKRNPQVTINENPNLARLPSPQPEQTPVRALGNSAQGQVPGVGRAKVRITFRRVRLLDPDNAYGSAKALLDGLQKAGLLDGDSAKEIELEVRQEKVAPRRRDANRDRV